MIFQIMMRLVRQLRALEREDLLKYIQEVECIQEYADNDLWGPCPGWPDFAIKERSIQQWAVEEILNDIFKKTDREPVYIVRVFINKMQRCLVITQRNMESEDAKDTYSPYYDEVFKIAINTAKDILYIIKDYYGNV